MPILTSSDPERIEQEQLAIEAARSDEFLAALVATREPKRRSFPTEVVPAIMAKWPNALVAPTSLRQSLKSETL